jgi:sporulation-control protein spo0M
MLKKFKNWLGIEGVKVAAVLTEPFTLSSKKLTGELRIYSKTAQYVKEIEVHLQEEYSRGWRKSKLTDKYDLGRIIIDVNNTVPAESDLLIPFKLVFHVIKSPIDKMGDKNIVSKGISTLAKKLKNAKSKYILLAVVKVRGVALDPYDRIELLEGEPKNNASLLLSEE